MLWELGITLKMEPTSWQPVLPFGSFFLDFGPDPDFAPDPDFFQEIGPVIALELPYLNYFTQNASYELLYSHYFFKLHYLIYLTCSTSLFKFFQK